MVSQKVGIRRQSKELQVQGAQFLRNEATLKVAAMIYPACPVKSGFLHLTGVKSALPSRFARFNPDGIKDKNRFHGTGTAGDAARHRNWTFSEAVTIELRLFNQIVRSILF